MKTFWYNDERKNKCGTRIREVRKQQNLTIEKLAAEAQVAGYDFITANLITKIELGIRFAADYEIAIFAELLHTTPNDLLGFNDISANK